jgi:hypothetical protein
MAAYIKAKTQVNAKPHFIVLEIRQVHVKGATIKISIPAYGPRLCLKPER